MAGIWRSRLSRLLGPSGDSMLPRVRRVLLMLYLCQCALTILQLAVGHRPAPARLAASGALVLLVAWWIRCLRRDRFPVAGEVLEVLPFLLLGLAFGNLTNLFAVFFFGFNFRVMYGSGRVVAVRTGLYMLSLTGAALIIGGPDALTAVFGVAPGLVCLAVFGRLVSTSMTRQGQAIARERMLTAAGTRLQEASDRDEIHHIAVTVAIQLTNATGGVSAILSVPRSPGEVEIVAGTGDDAEGLVGRRLRLDTMPAVLGPSATRLETVYAERLDEQTDGMIPPGLKTGAVLLLPLAVRDELCGILAVSSDRPIRREIHAGLETLASQVTLRLYSATLTDQLLDMAYRDSLTGLPNRASIHRGLSQALANARSTGTRVALLLVDLDGFKQINDTLGHAAGDDVLVAVADRLRGCVRSTELVGRLGGDEFAVIVEDVTDGQAVVRVAERITTALREPLTVTGQRVRVGSSIGVAVTGAEPLSANDLMRHADVAMYRAKRRGTGGHELHDLRLPAIAAHPVS